MRWFCGAWYSRETMEFAHHRSFKEEKKGSESIEQEQTKTACFGRPDLKSTLFHARLFWLFACGTKFQASQNQPSNGYGTPAVREHHSAAFGSWASLR